MDDIITLDYGSGGKKTAALIDEIIIPELGNNTLNALGDGAILDGQLAFSTESFVVDPLFFPGGDIGKLRLRDGERPRHVRRGAEIPEPRPHH